MSAATGDKVIATRDAARMAADVTKSVRTSRWPSGIAYIIGNEACERFSYYGMRAILFVYLTALFVNFVPLDSLPADQVAAVKDEATARTHLFFAGVYAFPMLGALFADRLFGKFPVILWVSLLYCVGHGVLALFGDTVNGVYIGLAFIAFGAGGIKPCVSANVGDQFTKANEDLVAKVFQIFYFSINFGSFFATLLIPWLYKTYGASVAFGVPGVLMAIATIVFWLGRNRFVKVPGKPGGKLGWLDALSASAMFASIAVWVFFKEQPLWAKVMVSMVSAVTWLALFMWRQSLAQDNGFLSVLVYSVMNQGKKEPGMKFFDVARKKFGDEAADGSAAVVGVMKMFSLVCVFWALFDQHASSWVRQAQQMDLAVTLPFFGPVTLQPSQLQALNPAMVMVIIPLLNFVIYPVVEKLGLRLTPLRKMATGMFLASLAFVIVATLQHEIDTLAAAGQKISGLWQAVPYVVMTTAEILVSAVGLEFAYTQAPRSMKSTIMGFWMLTISIGDLLVVFLAGFHDLQLVNFFWTFSGLMAVAAVGFAVLATFYKGKTFLQDGTVHG